MPTYQELKKVPKQWIVNVAYSLIGDDFASWVMKQFTIRNQRVQMERDQMISIVPEIRAIWEASTALSSKYSLLSFCSCLYNLC